MPETNSYHGINKQNALEANVKSLELRQNLGPKPILQAIELQQLMMNDARNPDLKPIIRAGIARAFVELEMLKLRLRMKPAPKPVDVSKPRKSSRKAAAFVELPQAQVEPPKT